MDVVDPQAFTNRAEWRAWLHAHHQTKPVVWVLIGSAKSTDRLVYLDAVEEALCFGWIDSTAKTHAPGVLAQRFTPRRAGSRWTELNKARARRLIGLGLMTDAGAATLPDLTMRTDVAPDIEAALRATASGWRHWQQMPALYRAIRLSYVEDVRRTPTEFRRRLDHLVDKTAANVQFGNWTDGGRLTASD